LSQAPQSRATAGNWTMYQFAPHHNAVFNRPGFRAHWSFSANAKINGGLAVVGNTLLLDTFGKEVIALDARTGVPLWRARMRNIVMSTPVVANGLVYVGTGANDLLDKNGDLMLRMQYAHKDVWGVPGGDEIVALNVRDGSTRWRYHTVGEDMPSPVYDRGRIIFANGDWHAYALHAVSGKEIWRRNIGGVSTMASATVAAGHIIVAACADGIRRSSTLALDPNSGEIVWESPYGHCDASPTYANDKIFVASVAPGAMKYVGRTVVAALDAQTGKPLWTYRAPVPGVWTMLASDESAIAGTYYAGTYYQPAPLTGQLLAFDAQLGKLRWSFDTAGPIKMSPVIKAGRLYVGDTTGVLYELDSTTGALLKATPYKKPFTTSPPVIVGETMFIVNGESVYAMQL
jgi:outer membrane protein assembly factor BamB